MPAKTQANILELFVFYRGPNMEYIRPLIYLHNKKQITGVEAAKISQKGELLGVTFISILDFGIYKKIDKEELSRIISFSSLEQHAELPEIPEKPIKPIRKAA